MKKVLIVIGIGIIIAISVFAFGFGYYSVATKNSESQVEKNLAEAKRIYESIPLWHKKIKTYQVLKVGIITDTHVRPNRIDKTSKSEDAPRYLKEKYTHPLRNFVTQMGTFDPEYIIHGGDLIEGTGDEDWLGIMGVQMVDEELQKAAVPVYYVLGNHELRSITKTQFRETLGLEDESQVIDTEDYRFVIIDGNYHPDGGPESGPDGNRYVPGYVSEEELAWLKEQLSTDKRTFVFLHQGPFLDRSPGDGDDMKNSISNAQELQDILYEYRVDGFFNGHMEARRYEMERFTEFYSLTGTKKSLTYPESYYELTITNGKPDLTMYYLPTGSTEVKQVDFESCRDAIDCGDKIEKED